MSKPEIPESVQKMLFSHVLAQFGFHCRECKGFEEIENHALQLADLFVRLNAKLNQKEGLIDGSMISCS